MKVISKANTKQYDENYDRVFRKQKLEETKSSDNCITNNENIYQSICACKKDKSCTLCFKRFPRGEQKICEGGIVE